MKFNLSKKIEEWVKNDVINRSDAESILKYENQYRPNYVLQTVLGIACLAIVIGIISIIASNWNKVPVYLKLASNFSAHLITLSSIYYFNKKKNKKITDLLIGVEFGMIIGTIALIGQIYHLDGHLFSSTSFWLIASTPLVLYSSYQYVPFAWAIIFTVVCFLGIDFHYDRFYQVSSLFEKSSLCVAFTLYWLSHLFNKYKKHNFYKVTHDISIFLFISFTTLITSIAWNIKNSDLELKEFLVITILFAIPTVIYLVKKQMKDAAIITSIGTLLFLLPQYINHDQHKVIAGASFLIFWILIARFAYKRQIKSIFDAATFLIAVRIMVIYFEVFGSLLETGIGLIMAGILTIVVIYLWQKQKNKAWKKIGDANE